MPNAALLGAVSSWLERQRIQEAGMVVAVSGGPDSVALLLALHGLVDDLNLGVMVGHLNHRLRSAESDADQAYVEALCKRLELPIAIETSDVREVARQAGDNLEATARRLRYDWLTRLAKEKSASFVATGHTADDQAETILHHLLRGTGLRGLRGIAARRSLSDGVELIRPLLRVTRSQVMEFLGEQGVETRTDSSNLDLRLTRNRIRHELLPKLAGEFNPAIVEHLSQIAEHATMLYAELENQARTLLAQAERPRAGDVIVLDAQTLREAPRHRTREALHYLWAREVWPVGAMHFEHWDRLVALVHEDAGSHDLPEGVRAVRKAGVLQVHGPKRLSH
jgi:tRNA(Ile)-lysidine synthase